MPQDVFAQFNGASIGYKCGTLSIVAIPHTLMASFLSATRSLVQSRVSFANIWKNMPASQPSFMRAARSVQSFGIVTPIGRNGVESSRAPSRRSP
jgi:hypothetical protein